MKFTILTIFPNVFEQYFETSIIKKAISKKHVEIELINFREFSKDKHQKVDDIPYGGGPGMVLMLQPIIDALNYVKTKDSYVVLLDPSGQTLKQNQGKFFLEKKHIILISGHYEGFDERIYNYVDACLSIGDYILSGGELPAMVFVDFITRQLSGVINSLSLNSESFDKNLLDYPNYTKPQNFEGFSVPEVLLSGHHNKINEFRFSQQIEKTKKFRKDLYLKYLKEVRKNGRGK